MQLPRVITGHRIILKSSHSLTSDSFYVKLSYSLSLPTTLIDPILLYLIDELKPTCDVVLEHNWLTHYNLSIDWVLGQITFKTPIQEGSNGETVDASCSTAFSTHQILTSIEEIATPFIRPSISLVSAEAFTRAAHIEGSQVYQLAVSDLIAQGRATSDLKPKNDLDLVPQEYYEFTNVFNNSQADALAPHHSYDLKIELEEELLH
ncbi:hypothetical protein Clacol_004562 [Clathrus columnatus]|uniref:Uncharacterized protein n=1 Tax=Clathrus columnatus TaxID=1419009 RepID=A0AAV5A6S8_9AGAM|nr:hypothetical protein Clacol_004562 [Clathrus columnatus]